MDRYMVTHSLLTSWQYSMRENPYIDEIDPWADFMTTLCREPSEPSEAMQNGIEFENLITAIINGERCYGWVQADPKNPAAGMVPKAVEEWSWYEAANEIAEILKDAALQLKVAKTVPGPDWDWLLYGRMDAVKNGVIYDIKFSKRYERGKYLTSTQHPMYLELLPEADRFVYLISNGTEVWSETYLREDASSIMPMIADFTEWLKAHALLDTYKQHWEAMS